jgi:hypothetical protein
MGKHAILIATLLASVTLTGCQTDDWQGTAANVLGQLNQSGALGSGNVGAGLTQTQIAQGLREALNVSSKTVVAQVGKSGGFNLDPQIKIPLPQSLQKVDSALKAVGMGQLTTDLQNKMNAAAEQGSAQALDLFITAISKMTIDDARQILSGQQDAATQYLRKSMGEELAAKFRPIIDTTLAQTGAVKAFDTVTGQYAALPFVSGLKTDLNDYVTQKAMDGVFYYVAQEEAAIRQNPAKRTTEILRTVFGAK